MDTETTPTPTQDKQITVDVPEDRVPEFYAWYARFLAAPTYRRRRHGGHRGHRCAPRTQTPDEATPATPTV